MDGKVPAGFFESEGPVDQQKRGSEPSWRLCFLGPKMSVRNLGDLRIWSMEPPGVSAAGPDNDEEHMRPQMLPAETTR